MLNLFRSYKTIQLPKTTSAKTTKTIAITTTWGSWGTWGNLGNLVQTSAYSTPTTEEGAFYDNCAFTFYTRQRENSKFFIFLNSFIPIKFQNVIIFI